MNKLMLNKGKAMACLILMCLFCAQSCRKESFKLAESPPKGQLIKQEAINTWLQTNPIANYISLDWSKARQAVIEGKNVVRIPTLNIDKISALNKSATIKENLLASTGKIAQATTTGSNTNYYAQHPPEVFFIQDDGSTKLHSYLLNFVPTDKTKEFGENGLWTGKLYEWNLTGDTIFIQAINKNIQTEKYAIKVGKETGADNLSTTLKNNKLQSLNGLKDKTTSNVFGWLVNAIEAAIGWVGDIFGLSYWAPSHVIGDTDYGSGYRISPINWDSLFGGSGNGGGGGSGGGGGDSYTYAGTPIYGGYLPGYENGNQGVYTDPYTYYPHGGGGPSYNAPLQNPDDLIISDLGITDYNQTNFLYNHLDIQEAIRDYLNTNGWTEDNMEYGRWTVEYLTENSGVSFEELLNAEYDNETIFPEDTEITNYVELSIDNSETRIVISPQDMVKYPKFTLLVKGLYNRVATTPKIMAALVKYTGFTETSILNDLKFDKRGPIIYITPKEQMKTYNPKTKSYTYSYGRCISNDVNKPYIFLNKEFIDLLEAANGTNSDALFLLLAATILHEYVHWSDNNFGLSPSLAGEMGELFEKDAFGGVLQYNKKNGKIYYRKQ